MLLTAGPLLLLINPPPQLPKRDSTKACFWAHTWWVGWEKHEKVMAYILFKMSSVLTTFCMLHLTTLHTPCTSPHDTTNFSEFPLEMMLRDFKFRLSDHQRNLKKNGLHLDEYYKYWNASLAMFYMYLIWQVSYVTIKINWKKKDKGQVLDWTSPGPAPLAPVLWGPGPVHLWTWPRLDFRQSSCQTLGQIENGITCDMWLSSHCSQFPSKFSIQYTMTIIAHGTCCHIINRPGDPWTPR